MFLFLVQCLLLLAVLDEGAERVHRACFQDKLVLQQFSSGWSVIGILDQAGSHETSKVSAESIVKSRWWILGDMEECLHGMQVCIWRLALDKLHGGDTKRPDVRLEVVAVLLDDLRGHPEWCADKRVSLRLYVCDLRGDPKICNFDLASMREKDVGGLDITMDLARHV